MNARARGFTLIEMLIVTLLSAIVMGAVYQTLTVQLRSNRQVNAVVGTQQTIRTGVQILQSELREVGGRAGDIRAAAPESLRVRALRKAGFVCVIPNPAGTSVVVHTVGDPFADKDSLLFYASRAGGPEDDTVRVSYVNGTPSAAAGCPKLTGMPWDSLRANVETLNLSLSSAPQLLNETKPGDPIRSYQTITYGIFQKGGSWVLGRRVAGDSVVTLIGPLASPASGGLVLTYLDTKNNVIPAGSLAALRDSIARVRVSIKGSARGAPGSVNGVYTDSLVADIFLRGN